MKAFGKGCLEFLIVWALAAAGLYLYLETRFTPPAPRYAAAAAGFLLASAWGLWRNSWVVARQLRLLNRAHMGERPSEGAPFAAVGQARPVSTPLQTPFLKRACVLYSYELFSQRRVTTGRGRKRRTDTQKVTYLTGLAMTPWAVSTSFGPVRVLGFPIPDQFPEDEFPADEHTEALTAFHAQTAFADVTSWDIRKLLGSVKEILSEDDGVLRQDLRFSEAKPLFDSPDALSACTLKEQCVPAGAPVCAIGTYDGRKGGLVQDLEAGGLLVIPGTAEEAAASLRSRRRGYRFFATLLLLLGTGGVYGLLTLQERSPQVRSVHAKDLQVAVEANDLEAVRAALQRGVATLPTDAETRSLLNTAPSREMFDLLVSGGWSPDTPDADGRPPLVLAYQRKDQERLAWLLEAGANPNASYAMWRTSLIDMAFDRNDRDLTKRLTEAGARGTFATPETGRPLAGEREVFESILNRYGAALRNHDAAALRLTVDERPSDYFDSVTRGLYETSRPATWRIEEGYLNEEVATVVATGDIRPGVTERYVVTFVRRQDQWVIRRDHFDEYFSFQF